MHHNVAKVHKDLTADQLYGAILRPIRDGTNDPELVHTPSFWNGCLEYKGEALVEGVLADAWGGNREEYRGVIEGLERSAERIVKINKG